MPFGHGLYLAIKNSRALQVTLLVGTLIAAYFTNNALVARRAREKYRTRAKIRTMEMRIEAQDEIETIKEEASHEADEAIAAGHDAGRSSVLSDATLARTLGRSRPSTRSG